MYFGINRRRNLSKQSAQLSKKWHLLLRHGTLGFLFVPGLFFVAMGLCAVVAPQLLVLAMAGFFLFLGASFFFVAWKFIQLKKRFDHLAKNFEARVYLQSVRPPQFEEEEAAEEQKKVVYH
jgi:hypothetical protein